RLSGIERIIGSGNNDTLYGDGNANTLDGGNGNDTLVGGAGADSLVGGLGTDTADYSTSAAVTVYLDGTAGVGGDAQGDVLNGIERIIGSANNDTLYGDGSANTLDGGNSNDTLVGGAGADSLIGGLGTDTADYSASAAVTVYLDGTAGVGGDAAGDVLSGIERIIGSGNNDTLFGDGSANTLDGGNGNDTLVGGAGADSLIGGLGTDTASYLNAGGAVVASLANSAGNTGDAAGDVYSGIENLTGSNFADSLAGDTGNNTLDGGTGDDTLIGGAGADSLIGGAGTDTASYAGASAGVVASLGNAAINTGDASGDSYNGIENLLGSSFNDALHGDGGNNTLDGGVGFDTLVGGAGADSLIGGAGTDTASYITATSGVVASLANAAINTGDAAGDSYNGIENLFGSDFNDELYGDLNNNTLTGGLGNDTLDGGAGDDILLGGAGGDSLVGGIGTDTATYAGASGPLTASLENSAINTGDATGDVYNGVENLTGSSFNDALFGDGGNNTLDGSNGADTLVGGAGADSLIGGAGTDMASYATAGSAIALTLNGAGTGTGTLGDANGDQLSGIERVLGSAYNDNFTLSLGNGWTIDGGAGTDTVGFAANSGTITESQLTGVLTNTEVLDFTSSGTAANLSVTSSFIQSLVSAGNASAIQINIDANDTISIGAGSFVNYDSGTNAYTFYSDSSLTTQVAKMTVVGP
ncbi:calcium-binding protein, partial [Novosphingobium sp.]|uniref:beta strand repeat-containing protein n=1 Tax=Novosphingobium sp. TaxID=1874826 RepID=UPI002632343F